MAGTVARSDPRRKPALEAKLQEFYDELVKHANLRKVQGKEVLVYEGHYSNLYKQVIGNPTYYTPIRKILVETESISILQRGNISQETIMVLNHPPPAPDEWPDDLTGEQVSATLRASYERRLAALETWRETTTGGGKLNLLEVLRNFEERIAKLESQLDQLAKKEGKDNGKST